MAPITDFGSEGGIGFAALKDRLPRDPPGQIPQPHRKPQRARA